MIESGAIFDETGAYRYRLWRCWDTTGPKITFIMLNPSKADAEVNDPTIRRCIGFAQSWGYGSLDVVNLFAYRATNPKDLKQAKDPVGECCDRILLESARSAQMILLAWGNHGQYQQRGQFFIKRLTALAPLYCLGKTQTGAPKHPLYLKRETQPHPYFVNTSRNYSEILHKKSSTELT